MMALLRECLLLFLSSTRCVFGDVFGLLADFCWSRPTPPVQRALAETVKKLKAAGHELIDWDPELHDVLTKTLVRAITIFDLIFT